MASIIILLGLCVIMALASFLAGALPLSMSLSQSQLRLLSSVGIGILVGTSLIVIIPEGIEAATTPAEASHMHRVRSIARRNPWLQGFEPSLITKAPSMGLSTATRRDGEDEAVAEVLRRISSPQAGRGSKQARQMDEPKDEPKPKPWTPTETVDDTEVPMLEIGLSMILGFILMFLVDRLPRHATDSMQSGPQTRHFSLDTLGGDDSPSAEEEAVGFLGSLTPSPRRARSLATTVGLVIHAAADGIAMGASSTTSDMKLGLVIFLAIMIHKAPAAFGLTSVLLKQGLSKRAARGHLIVFSLAAPVGAVTTWLLITLLGGDHMDGNSWWTGMLLLFSGGTFLYVAMHAMQEDAIPHGSEHGSGANGYAEGGSTTQRKPKGPQIRDTIATVVGMLLPLLTQFGHHH